MFWKKKEGDLLLKMAEGGVEPAKNIVNAARDEGATDADIRQWWNFSEKQRQRLIDRENSFRYAVFLDCKDRGMTADEAALEVKRTFPSYGKTGDRASEEEDKKICSKLGLSVESRMIPMELRGRIDEYRSKVGADTIKTISRDFESYNAFIRQKIREKKI